MASNNLSLEIRLIGITGLGHALCHIAMLAFAGILSPMSADFHVSLTTAAMFGTLSYLGFGLGALPFGWLISRTSARFGILLFYIGTGVSSLLVFWSPNAIFFAIFLSLLGFFSSIYHVAGLSILSHFSKKIGRAYGIHGVAGSVGIAGGPLLAGLFATHWGWRFVYLLIALPALIGALFLIFDKSIPSHIPQETEEDAPQKKQSNSTSVFKQNRIFVFILFLMVMSINGFIYRGFTTFFPTFLSEAVHFNNMNAVQVGGLFSALIFALGMIGQYAGGYLSDRMNRGTLYLIILSLTFPFLWLMHLLSGWTLIGVASLFSIFYFQAQPVGNSMVSKLVPARWISSVFALQFTLSFGLGSLGAVFAGWIADNFGIREVLSRLSFIALIPLILTFVLLRLNHHKDVFKPHSDSIRT